MAAQVVRAFRIVSPRWTRTALSGEGARRYGGRWNPPGLPCVYLAESRALTALEMLVHLTPLSRGLRYQLLEVTFPASLVARQRPSTLPPGWREPSGSRGAQEFGRAWLEAGKSAVLRLPSAIIPDEHLYLLNPRHPEAAKAIPSKPLPFPFDSRLA